MSRLGHPPPAPADTRASSVRAPAHPRRGSDQPSAKLPVHLSLLSLHRPAYRRSRGTPREFFEPQPTPVFISFRITKSDYKSLMLRLNPPQTATSLQTATLHLILVFLPSPRSGEGAGVRSTRTCSRYSSIPSSSNSSAK